VIGHGHDGLLLHSDDARRPFRPSGVAVGGARAHPFAHARDGRRADEGRRQRSALPLQIDAHRVDLGAEGVALDIDVEHSQSGQDDESRAGPQRGQTRRGFGQRLAQPGQIQQLQQGGRFTAWQYEGVQTAHVLGAAYEDGVVAQILHKASVLDDSSLKPEDTDPHQPRSAKR